MRHRLQTGHLRKVTTDHCNYSPSFDLSYAKATDYFVNYPWVPRGQSGDGRCGHHGARTGVRCLHGYVNEESGR